MCCCCWTYSLRHCQLDGLLNVWMYYTCGCCQSGRGCLLVVLVILFAAYFRVIFAMPGSTRKNQLHENLAVLHQSNAEAPKLKHVPQKKLEKEERKRVAAQRRQVLTEARKLENLFSLLKPFKKFERNGLVVQLEHTTAEKLLKELPPGKAPVCPGEDQGMPTAVEEQPDTKDEVAGSDASPIRDGMTVLRDVFFTIKRNMKELYDSSNFNEVGWSDEQKWKEVTDSESRYIIAHVVGEHKGTDFEGNCSGSRGLGGSIAGFVHFRFEVDSDNPGNHKDSPVMYIWDLQLKDWAQRKGLGKHLINVLDLSARHLGMEKLMCTVLKENVGASKFYREKCGFCTDESSPDNFADVDDDELCEYDILRKEIRKN
eukprot:GHVQ01015042.1.p1 GENE.GHVQ01015042.1~~GHVQ01015042.1.p1  ORF type:complete len:371 (-),score=40.75 GHVQ01015042.1:344-1456(-)